MLYETIAPIKTLMIAGLAKNTGKTVALNALINAASLREDVLGITSIGRDGERIDALNNAIKKPSITLFAGTLVATSLALLQQGKVPFQILDYTPYRTPLGRIVIARLRGTGTLEISGPSTAAQIKQVCDVMLAHGANRVFIDGAINRKAATSPFIADGIVLATGAVLHPDPQVVVSKTFDWAEKLCLATISDTGIRSQAHQHQGSVAITPEGRCIDLNSPGSVLRGSWEIDTAMIKKADIQYLIVKGALSDASVQCLLGRTNSPLTFIVPHGGHLFLNDHSLKWYRSRGAEFKALHSIDLKAITINPVSPGAYQFDAAHFKHLLQAAFPNTPVFNVITQPTPVRTPNGRVSSPLPG